MHEGRKIISQQTIFAILYERILFISSSTNAMCIKNHCSVHHLHPQNILMGSCWTHRGVGSMGTTGMD